MQTAFRRAGIDVPGAQAATLVRPGTEPVLIAQRELPPLAELPSYTAGR
jgi:hypothetical protein